MALSIMIPMECCIRSQVLEIRSPFRRFLMIHLRYIMDVEIRSRKVIRFFYVQLFIRISRLISVYKEMEKCSVPIYPVLLQKLCISLHLDWLPNTCFIICKSIISMLIRQCRTNKMVLMNSTNSYKRIFVGKKRVRLVDCKYRLSCQVW